MTRFDKLLVLDLDETLVHATLTPLDRAPDFRVDRYALYRRPHLAGFLARCLEWFRVAVWTSSSAPYADAVVGRLFPDPARLDFVWSRERCTRRLDPDLMAEVWLKDLKKLKKIGYALEKTLIVDDSPEKIARQYGNHVRIAPFEGDPADRELEALLPFLERLGAVENVRTVEKRHWR